MDQPIRTTPQNAGNPRPESAAQEIREPRPESAAQEIREPHLDAAEQLAFNIIGKLALHHLLPAFALRTNTEDTLAALWQYITEAIREGMPAVDIVEIQQMIKGEPGK